MLVSVSKNWVDSLVSIYISNLDATQGLVLSSKDEMLIINVRDALRSNKKAKNKTQQPVVMNIEDNSIHIGNNNKISGSVIGSKNTKEIKQETVVLDGQKEKESFVSKSLWQIVVPIIVGVIVAAICVWLKLQ